MEQPRRAIQKTIVAIDIAGFGVRDRTNRNHAVIRRSLSQAMQEAFRQAGIPWDDSYPEDRGDGVLILVGDDALKTLFVESLPFVLVKVLQVHNSSHPDLERIRLRMALHAGEVNFDEHGATAPSINLTFNLLDSAPVKDAMLISPGALTIITSSWFFEEAVRHSTVAAAYRPVEVAVRGDTMTGWICVPDHMDPEHAAVPDYDQTGLLFRVYIPSERLYAAEAE